jgi:hypothetical protein
MAHELEALVLRHTHRLPLPDGFTGTAEGATGAATAGQGAVAARQFDAALTSVGFKLSAELLARLSGLSEDEVVRIAGRTLRTVSQMVGDHVRHNTYFIDFPADVADTEDFWAQCVAADLQAAQHPARKPPM